MRQDKTVDLCPNLRLSLETTLTDGNKERVQMQNYFYTIMRWFYSHVNMEVYCHRNIFFSFICHWPWLRGSCDHFTSQKMSNNELSKLAKTSNKECFRCPSIACLPFQSFLWDQLWKYKKWSRKYSYRNMLKWLFCLTVQSYFFIFYTFNNV